METTESGVDEDFIKDNDRALFKEHIVLTGIIFLTLLSEANSAEYTYLWRDTETISMEDSYLLYSVSMTAVPIPATMGMTFILEITGRKPVFITLFAFTIISSILSAIGSNHSILLLGLVIKKVVSGGSLAITFLAISEYCSAKHRFTYLMANAMAGPIGHEVITYLYNSQLLDVSSVILQILLIILGLVCLGSIWVWPESPYWLASKGRLIESKKAFLWLREEKSEVEFQALKQEQRRPGPTKLYWLSFLLGVATLSISLFSDLQTIRLVIFFISGEFADTKSQAITTCSIIVVGCILILISYKIKRKVFAVVVSTMPLLLSYVLAFWLAFTEGEQHSKPFLWILFINTTLQRVGPVMCGLAMYIETVVLKYNTHLTCVGFVIYHLLKTLHVFVIVRFIQKFSVSLALSTSLSVTGVILFNFLSQEPKDKTLLEIQKSYTPSKHITNIEPVPIAMQQLQNDKDQLEV